MALARDNDSFHEKATWVKSILFFGSSYDSSGRFHSHSVEPGTIAAALCTLVSDRLGAAISLTKSCLAEVRKRRFQESNSQSPRPDDGVEDQMRWNLTIDGDPTGVLFY